MATLPQPSPMAARMAPSSMFSIRTGQASNQSLEMLIPDLIFSCRILSAG